MILTKSKWLFECIEESLDYEKISEERKCPFCESDLDSDRYVRMKIIVARLHHLFIAAEACSKTAMITLDKIFISRKRNGGFDVPTDNAQWWIDIVAKIDAEVKR
jgi:hypothetical protein